MSEDLAKQALDMVGAAVEKLGGAAESLWPKILVYVQVKACILCAIFGLILVGLALTARWVHQQVHRAQEPWRVPDDALAFFLTAGLVLAAAVFIPLFFYAAYSAALALALPELAAIEWLAGLIGGRR